MFRFFCKSALYALVGIVVLSLLLTGCGGSDAPSITPAEPRGNTGSIETGKKTEAAKEKISPDGGTITVDDEKSPINGLELDVPAGAYPEDLEFKISSAPVEEHTFGDDFNPVTPLISVENGGGFSEEMMRVTIPVEVPDDHFAMGFIYDDETQTLEGMPLIARDAASITVGTHHFTDMLISMIPYAKLKKDIDTGFRPGIDDWQFVNYGSYLEAGGHCAGQCLTALWYYVNQPDGADLTLYGRYDNNGDDPATPDFWNDDSYGYRFASVIQHDINWDSFANGFWGNIAGTDDQTNYYLFAYSMQITGEPQEVGIFNSTGGHDMICYRIKDGNLYIADPNYPGDIDRRIEFKDGRFKPYNSGANAEEIAAGNGEEYPEIGYCAKSTTINWATLGQRWKEFKDGTIGDGIFPDYSLIYIDEKGEEKALPEELSWSQNSIGIRVKATAFTNGFVVYRDGVSLQLNSDKKFPLQNGENVLGIWVLGKVGDRWKYVDFKYVTINFSGLSIKPETQTGDTGSELTYEAVCDKPPKNARYNWYVDGRLMQEDEGSVFDVSFEEAGEYIISVEMTDEKGENPQEAEALAVIEGATPTTTTVDRLALLQEFKSVRGNISGLYLYDKVYSNSSESTSSYNTFEIPYYGWENSYEQLELEWNGTRFSSSHSNDLESHSLTGEVAPDGSKILRFEYAYTYSFSDSEGWEVERENRITLTDIPISESSLYSEFQFSKSGSEFKPYLSEFYYYELREKDGELREETTIESPDWTGEGWQKEPHITLIFKKSAS